MGLDPNDAATEIIKNGGFVDGSFWLALRDWTIAGGKATLDVTEGASSRLDQFPIIAMAGQEYLFSFTLSNCSFADPAKGIQVLFVDTGRIGPFRTNGIHTITYIPTINITQLLFIGPAVAIGDFCQLDDVSCINQGDYLNENFPLNLSDRYRKECWAANGADLFQNVADTTDKTSCQILFNRP